jgi:hypothetical protein
MIDTKGHKYSNVASRSRIISSVKWIQEMGSKRLSRRPRIRSCMAIQQVRCQCQAARQRDAMGRPLHLPWRLGRWRHILMSLNPKRVV